MVNQESTWERESSFHDDWATQSALEDRLVYESFESPLALEGRYSIDLVGDLKGKKVLDIGSGLGEAATYFAIKGADVTIVDLSPQMVASAQKLAHFHNVKLEGIVSPAESFDLPDNSYDFCYAANILHHVTDSDSVLSRVERVLKPGGLFVSWDPLIYNPVINIYRWMTRGKVRTAEEVPLGFGIIETVGKYFPQVQHKEFWFMANTIFLKYFLINRLNPNQTRYWKHILKEVSAEIRWLGPLLDLDKILLRYKPFQYFAWTMLIHARKRNSL